MNLNFLKNRLVLFHLILAISLAFVIWFAGWTYYNSAGLQNTIASSDFTIILVGIVIVQILANSWRISVVKMPVEKVEEKVPTLEEENLESLQKRMKKMNNGSENVVEEEIEKETHEETIEEHMDKKWGHEDIPQEIKKEPKVVSSEPTTKYNKDEILDWLIENSGKNLNDFKAMKDEKERLAEEQKQLAEEKKRRETEEKTQNILKDAAGQITTDDIKKVKNAIVQYWIDQISSGHISGIKPSKETLKNMGLEEDSWIHNDEERTVKTSSKKKDEKVNFT